MDVLHGYFLNLFTRCIATYVCMHACNTMYTHIHTIYTCIYIYKFVNNANLRQCSKEILFEVVTILLIAIYCVINSYVSH